MLRARTTFKEEPFLACEGMDSYYARHLSGTRLQRVYEIASPRMKRYLRAEIDHVVRRVEGATRILELGCGYGRVLREIAPLVKRAVGNDTSRTNLVFASSYLRTLGNCDLAQMNAARLAFPEAVFDAVLCVQNGISAFGVDRQRLVAEAVRVTREGGVVLFSTYSPLIWPDRLDWFRAQSRAGLLGELDESRSMDGMVVCRDGFRSEAVSGAELRTLFERVDQEARVYEVDGSSLFGEAVRKGRNVPHPVQTVT
jgi:2-polyprenyl-6-hydroxyphenyl methylase/3-demethylubiquinone-9 3-methyltransferase